MNSISFRIFSLRFFFGLISCFSLIKREMSDECNAITIQSQTEIFDRLEFVDDDATWTSKQWFLTILSLKTIVFIIMIIVVSVLFIQSNRKLHRAAMWTILTFIVLCWFFWFLFCVSFICNLKKRSTEILFKKNSCYFVSSFRCLSLHRRYYKMMHTRNESTKWE